MKIANNINKWQFASDIFKGSRRQYPGRKVLTSVSQDTIYIDILLNMSLLVSVRDYINVPFYEDIQKLYAVCIIFSQSM